MDKHADWVFKIKTSNINKYLGSKAFVREKFEMRVVWFWKFLLKNALFPTYVRIINISLI